MTSNKYSPKLKYYHVILISILLCPLLIINSNYLNKKREQEKALKQDIKILRQLYARKLDSSSDDDSFTSDTNKICEKGTKDLQNYYKTGDGSIIGIKEDEEIKSENNPKYIDALVNLISSEGSSGDNIKDYIMHLIPVLIFLVIAILSLPGWLVCCICSCCKCYCCSCCQKPVCKLPFYIVTMVIYALGICISIYGLSQSNIIFVGLADTECSLLKFIGEVLNGETKQTKPRWGGITNIVNTFEDVITKIDGLDEQTATSLSNSNFKAEGKKQEFETALQTYSKNIYDDENISGEGNYKHSLTLSNGKSGTYVLDIIKKFGKFTPTSTPIATSDSFVEMWYEEYKQVSESSKQQMEDSSGYYGDLLNEKSTGTSEIRTGINSIKDIQKTFDDVKDKISKIIIDYSDLIEKYGKLASKIVFYVLMVIDIAIVVFSTLKLFFSFGTGNCFVNCLTKSMIHILWNILGLLTFLTLLIGSLFYGLGTIGKDLISVVSFLVSDKNLQKGEDALLLGDAAKYLIVCINGDGDLKEALNFNISAMNNIDTLRTAKMRIEGAIEDSNQLLEVKIAYNNYLEKYNERKSYTIDNFKLIDVSDESKFLTFNEYLSEFNSEIASSKKDRWSITCESNEDSHSCESIDTSHSTVQYCIKPSTCQTKNVEDWYSSSTGEDSLKVTSAFIDSIKTAKKKSTITQDDLDSSSPFPTKSIENVLKFLNYKYTKFLESQTASLKIYNDTISELTDMFNLFAGNNGTIFDIVNGKFIGRNVKVILKYLEKSLGNNFKTMGICLIIVGLSMCISIPFTILLNLILDTKSSPIADGIQDLNPKNADTPFDTNLNANVNIENVDNNVEVEVGKVIEFNNNA